MKCRRSQPKYYICIIIFTFYMNFVNLLLKYGTIRTLNNHTKYRQYKIYCNLNCIKSVNMLYQPLNWLTLISILTCFT